MKKIILGIIASLFIINSVQSKGMLKKYLKREHTYLWRNQKYVKTNFGLSKYHVKDMTILDIGSNINELKDDSAKVVPFLGLESGIQWDAPAFGDGDGIISVGLGMNFAKRNNAVLADFYDGSETSPSFIVKQDVKEFRLTSHFEWEFYHQKRIALGASMLLGAAFKGLKDFRIHEKDTGYFTGQTLQSGKANFLAQFGGSLTFTTRVPATFFRINYNYGISSVKYNKQVILKTPHASAAQHHHDALLIEDQTTALILPERPKMKLRCHQWCFSLIREL